jgi:hypothetical protein
VRRRVLAPLLWAPRFTLCLSRLDGAGTLAPPMQK